MPAISEQPIEQGADIPADLKELLANTQNDAWKITKFETTPPMSSYIVAFANGDFEYLESSVKMPLSGKTIPLRIYSKGLFFYQSSRDLQISSDQGRHSPSSICARRQEVSPAALREGLRR